jgi:hypothetical protein
MDYLVVALVAFIPSVGCIGFIFGSWYGHHLPSLGPKTFLRSRKIEEEPHTERLLPAGKDHRRRKRRR